MQKRKSTKKDNITRINTDDMEDDFFNAAAATAEMSFASNVPIGIENAMGSMITEVVQSSMDLSKLVVENRVRNADHMIDEDIYDIHKKSFQLIKGNLDDLKEE